MQKSNLLDSYTNSDEHIYDSICDVNQNNFRTHPVNETYRTLSTDSIENSWQKYWEWCSSDFFHFFRFLNKRFKFRISNSALCHPF